MNPIIIRRFSSLLLQKPLSSAHLRRFSSGSTDGNDDDWNDAWETAWLPPEKKPTTATIQDPWEDLPSSTTTTHSSLSSSDNTETRAFVEDMNENWEQRRTPRNYNNNNNKVESMKRDYRVKKQRIHAGLWVKEIEKREEARLMGDDDDAVDHDIQRLLDSCSEIFDSPNADIDKSKIPSSSELKNKPDGWETTAKAQDGSVWEMSQREDDVLLQEFERRIAFCKFQCPVNGSGEGFEEKVSVGWQLDPVCKNSAISAAIWTMEYIIEFGPLAIVLQLPYLLLSASLDATSKQVGLFEVKRKLLVYTQIASFIKTHIFSRRRPIDGWKYMIEEIGPNARKGKGSVSRIPSLSDEATQPFREERTPIASNAGYIKGR